MAENKLYYGDNLDVLRRYVADGSVDLIYLDPPFKSNQDYNVLFEERNGSQSAAQIKAFEDTWRWSLEAEHAYQEVVEAGGPVSRFMQGMRSFLGENDMMAYLAMMAPRLVELRRVLKPAGSIYLHCDSTASAHLRLLTDAVFGSDLMRAEIIWKRTYGHGGATNYHRIHDTILYFARSSAVQWHGLRLPHGEAYLESHYRHADGNGGRYQLITAHGPGQGPQRRFGTRMIAPPRGRHWMDQETIDRDMEEGRIVFTKSGMPRRKRYLDETEGRPLTDVWEDILPINSQAAERLGYPTQKPEALLERIIQASSNEGDLVLDPFCGCGTAVAVAQRLGRRWIGIDVTHLAITLIKHRLKDTFPDKVIDEREVRRGVEYDVIGEPADLAGASALAMQDPYQFQFWALGLVGARPTEEKKGADRGIDGRLYFHDEKDTRKTKQVILQVKAGHVGVKDVRELMAVIEREKAQIGALISLQEPTRPMRTEAAAAGFYKSPWWEKEFPRVQLLTVSGILRGKTLEYPPATSATFKRAPRAKSAKPGPRTRPLHET